MRRTYATEPSPPVAGGLVVSGGFFADPLQEAAHPRG